MTGRGKHTGVRDIFQGGGSGDSYLWVGDMGDETPHGPGPGDFPEQGGLMDHINTAMVALGRKLRVPPLEEVTEEEMWEVGLDVVEAYVSMRKNAVAQCY